LSSVVVVCSRKPGVADFIASYLRDAGIPSVAFIDPVRAEIEISSASVTVRATVIHCYPPALVDFPFYPLARRLSNYLTDSRRRIVLLAPNERLAGWDGLATIFVEHDVFSNLTKLAKYLKRLPSIGS